MTYGKPVIDFFNNLFRPPYTMLVILAVIFLVLGLILKIIVGTAEVASGTAKAAFDLLFVYIAGMLLYGEGSSLNRLIRYIPFWDQVLNSYHLEGMFETDQALFFQEIFKMFVLAAVAGLVNIYVEPNVKKLKEPWGILVWLFWEGVTIVVGIAACWGCDQLLENYLMSDILKWIPAILLVLMAVIVLITVLKIIFRTAKFLAGPSIGKLFDIFMKKSAGHAFTSAFCAAALFTGALMIAEKQQALTTFMRGSADLLTVLPALIVTILCGYLVSKKF